MGTQSDEIHEQLAIEQEVAHRTITLNEKRGINAVVCSVLFPRLRFYRCPDTKEIKLGELVDDNQSDFVQEYEPVLSDYDKLEEARGQEVRQMFANKAWKDFTDYGPLVNQLLAEKHFFEMCVEFAKHLVRPPHGPNSWPNCIHTRTVCRDGDTVQIERIDVGKFLHDSGRKYAALLLEAADTNNWQDVRDFSLPFFKEKLNAVNECLGHLQQADWHLED